MDAFRQGGGIAIYGRESGGKVEFCRAGAQAFQPLLLAVRAFVAHFFQKLTACSIKIRLDTNVEVESANAVVTTGSPFGIRKVHRYLSDFLTGHYI